MSVRCWEGKTIWMMVGIFITGLMVFHLLQTYYIIKPITSSIEKRVLLKEDIPDILICKDIAFDHDKLKGFGYNTPNSYQEGISQEGKFIGWNGRKMEDPFRHITKNSQNQSISLRWNDENFTTLTIKLYNSTSQQTFNLIHFPDVFCL